MLHGDFKDGFLRVCGGRCVSIFTDMLGGEGVSGAAGRSGMTLFGL